jgi:hypothetical protein
MLVWWPPQCSAPERLAGPAPENRRTGADLERHHDCRPALRRRTHSGRHSARHHDSHGCLVRCHLGGRLPDRPPQVQEPPEDQTQLTRRLSNPWVRALAGPCSGRRRRLVLRADGLDQGSVSRKCHSGALLVSPEPVFRRCRFETWNLLLRWAFAGGIYGRTCPSKVQYTSRSVRARLLTSSAPPRKRGIS